MESGVRPETPPCPRCKCARTECLEGISSRSMVDYFRCLECGNVWTSPRAATEAPCDVPPAVGE